MKIAYVFTEVPQVAGMFPNAELDALAKRGVAIELFILRNRAPQTVEAKRIASTFVVHRSRYLLSLRLLGDLVSALVRRPGPFLSTGWCTVRDTISSPKILIKSLAILPKSIHFAAVARRRGITLVHAYWASLPAQGASVMGRFADLPFTTWAHAGSDIYNRNHQTDAALRSRLREAGYVLTCNAANLGHFEKLLDATVLQKVELLTHGVDPERFQPVEGASGPEPGTVFAVGRLSPAKGYQILLEACRLLKERGLSFRCSIAGTGQMAAELETLRVRLELRESVELLGHVDHPKLPDLYRASEIFVMPSIIGPKGSRDGLPNVLLEAMATEVACIGTEVASIPEAIEHEQTGLLVPPADPVALADAIERLLQDADLRKRLGTAAREKVRKSFGREAAMDRLLQIFRDLHNDRGAQS